MGKNGDAMGKDADAMGKDGDAMGKDRDAMGKHEEHRQQGGREWACHGMGMCLEHGHCACAVRRVPRVEG